MSAGCISSRLGDGQSQHVANCRSMSPAPLFQDFSLLGWALEQPWTDGSVGKSDSVARLEPGQLDTERE